MLQQIVEGETVGDRTRRHTRCHVSNRRLATVSFCSCRRALEANLERWLEPARKHPVVTVGESPGFIAAGGIINLVNVGGRIRFEINATAARRNDLDISSRLLALAVTGRPE